MAQHCQASLPWHCHVATPACSAYLASTATWRQKHRSYTSWHNLKYRTFLFVDIAEFGTVSVLSSNQNEADIGCQLKPETLTWPDLANTIGVWKQHIQSETLRLLLSKCYFCNEWSTKLVQNIKMLFYGVSPSDLSSILDRSLCINVSWRHLRWYFYK